MGSQLCFVITQSGQFYVNVVDIRITQIIRACVVSKAMRTENVNNSIARDVCIMGRGYVEPSGASQRM